MQNTRVRLIHQFHVQKWDDLVLSLTQGNAAYTPGAAYTSILKTFSFVFGGCGLYTGAALYTGNYGTLSKDNDLLFFVQDIPCEEFQEWPNGHCKHVYREECEDARKHMSNWAMRNTNNHNVSILKKSCLGVLVCSVRCSLENGDMVHVRPAICDKARRKQIGKGWLYIYIYVVCVCTVKIVSKFTTFYRFESIVLSL